MKKLLLFTAVVASIGCMAFILAPAPHVEVFKLDPQASTLEWKGKKLTGEHKGTIKFFGGELKNNHGSVSGKFDVDMLSIAVTDLQGDSKTKLENHLKSDDFFGTAQFPRATFAITSLVQAADEAGNTHTVGGNLTIRDKTNPVTFKAKFEDDGMKMKFTGTAIIDRSKYDVKHRSQTFFPSIGDKIVYDDFELTFNVVLNKPVH